MSDENSTFDLNSDEAKAAIAAAVNAAIAPLKAKNDELISEKRKLQESMSAFDGIDRETLASYVNRLKNDEETKLIAEGKLDEVIGRRTDRMREAYDNKVADANKKAETLASQLAELSNEFNNRMIDISVKDAAVLAGVVPSALDDIRFRGRSIFSYKDGKLVVIDPATKEVRVGADGKTPYGPTDFIEDLKKSAPHFWPQSSGGGMSGARGGSTGDPIASGQAALNSAGGFDAYRKQRAEQRKRS